MDSVTFVIAWLFLSLAVGIYADRKGRGMPEGFLLSLLLSPLIGFIIVALMRENREKQGKARGDKKCPSCAEWVKREALKCRFCGHEFQPIATPIEGRAEPRYKNSLLLLSPFLIALLPATAHGQSAQGYDRVTPCLIAKHKGTIGRRLMWTALIGVPIAPGSKYDYVDSVNYKPTKLKWGEEDLKKIQAAGVHVIILNNDYTAAEMTSAHGSCAGAGPSVPVDKFGIYGTESPVGFVVSSVSVDSPAARASLKTGDIITRIDGREVHSASEIDTVISASVAGALKVGLLIQTASVGLVTSEREVRLR